MSRSGKRFDAFTRSEEFKQQVSEGVIVHISDACQFLGENQSLVRILPINQIHDEDGQIWFYRADLYEYAGLDDPNA